MQLLERRLRCLTFGIVRCQILHRCDRLGIPVAVPLPVGLVGALRCVLDYRISPLWRLPLPAPPGADYERFVQRAIHGLCVVCCERSAVQ